MASRRAPTPERRLDVTSFEDSRCRQFPVDDLFAKSWTATPRRWEVPPPLDQGFSGACVGFAWAHALASEPIRRPGVDATFAVEEVYWNAQRFDRFPGGEYPGAAPRNSGTSVLAAAKALKSLGIIGEYRWAFSIESLLLTVSFLGPVVLGCRWYRGFDQPDEQSRIHATGPLMGRHCVVVSGLVRSSAPASSADDLDLAILNSRGPSWGNQGHAVLPVAALRRVWADSEACLALTACPIENGL